MPCKAYCVYKNHRWKITKDSVEIVLHAAEEQGKRKGGASETRKKKTGTRTKSRDQQAWALNERIELRVVEFWW